jgi:hypothetical protein
VVLDEVEAALSLWDRLKKLLHARKNPPVESIATRFVRLFESHGVYRNQIPRFFGHSLTVQDVQDDASLVAKLDETILEAACKRFAVRREWLDGAESQIHPGHDFYKHPEGFADFLTQLKTANPDGELRGVLIAPDDQGWQAGALLILQETVGAVGEKPIYRYHLCNNWIFSYWKARAYLTACVAIAWKQGVYVHGLRISAKEIEELAKGKTLLSRQGEGVWNLCGSKKWYPEDMALKPETFLEGVDPERDNFGIKAGLTRWLELDGQGLMDTGGPTKNVRQLFQQELEKYST